MVGIGLGSDSSSSEEVKMKMLLVQFSASSGYLVPSPEGKSNLRLGEVCSALLTADLQMISWVSSVRILTEIY